MSPLFDTAVRFFVDGGPVMYPIAVLSLVAVALSFERLVFWRRAATAVGRPASSDRSGASPRSRWLTKLSAALRRGDFSAAESLCRNNPTLYAWYVEELLDAGVSEAAAMDVVDRLRPRVERSSLTLSTIVTAAPMLGILGTVTGIIQSFGLLGATDKTGGADPTAVAGGIAEALYTTAFGLVVALIALFPYVWCRSAADALYTRLESLTACALEGSRKLADRAAKADATEPRAPASARELAARASDT